MGSFIAVAPAVVAIVVCDLTVTCQCPPAKELQEHTRSWTNWVYGSLKQGKTHSKGNPGCVRRRVLWRTDRTRVVWGDLGEGSRKQDFALDWTPSENKGNSVISYWSVIWTTPVQKAGRTQWNKEAESTLLPGAGARWSFLCFRQCYVFVWVQTWLWRDVGLHLIPRGHRVGQQAGLPFSHLTERIRQGSPEKESQ